MSALNPKLVRALGSKKREKVIDAYLVLAALRGPDLSTSDAYHLKDQVTACIRAWVFPKKDNPVSHYCMYQRAGIPNAKAAKELLQRAVLTGSKDYTLTHFRGHLRRAIEAIMGIEGWR